MGAETKREGPVLRVVSKASSTHSAVRLDYERDHAWAQQLVAGEKSDDIRLGALMAMGRRGWQGKVTSQ